MTRKREGTSKGRKPAPAAQKDIDEVVRKAKRFAKRSKIKPEDLQRRVTI